MREINRDTLVNYVFFVCLVVYLFVYIYCGGQNLSLCVGLGSHSLITLRPRRRKHEKGPVIDNRADEYPVMLVREGYPPRI